MIAGGQAIGHTGPVGASCASRAVSRPASARHGQAFVKLTRNSSVPVSAIETMKPPMFGAVIE